MPRRTACSDPRHPRGRRCGPPQRRTLQVVGNLLRDPEHFAALAQTGFFFLLADATMEVATGRVAANDHAGTDGGVGEAIDDDEGAGGRIGFVGIKDQRRCQSQRDAADFVEVQFVGRFLGERVDVDGMGSSAIEPVRFAWSA